MHMKQWLCGISVALVCVLTMQTAQVSTYAKTVATKRQVQSVLSSKTPQKLASSTSQHALSVQRLTTQIERALKTCSNALQSKSQPKHIRVSSASNTIPFEKAIQYCPQLVDLLTSKQIVSLTGVLELPVLAQLMQLIAGLSTLGAGAIAVILGKIVLVIVGVLVLLGIIWCFVDGAQCKKQTDAIKNAVLNFFHQHMMPRLRSLMDDDKNTKEIQRNVVSQFERDWKDTSTKIKNGASREVLIREAQKTLNDRVNQLPKGGPTGPNNNRNSAIPPKSTRASASNHDDIPIYYLSEEQIKAINKVDEKCAGTIRFLQETLKGYMNKFYNEYVDDKDPNISAAERAYLNELSIEIIDSLKKYFVELREVLVKNRNNIYHHSSVEKYDDLIQALPKSTNEKMGLPEIKNLLDKLKYYYVPRTTSRLNNVVIPEKVIMIDGKVSISDPIFYLINSIDFWYVFLTKIKATAPDDIKQCMISNTRCLVNEINDLLRDFVDALDNAEEVKKLCKYVQSYLSRLVITIQEIENNIYDHTSSRYEKDIFNPKSNAIVDIVVAIKALIERIVKRK